MIFVILVAARISYQPGNTGLDPFANPSTRLYISPVPAQETARLMVLESSFESIYPENDFYHFYKIVNSRSSLCSIKLTADRTDISFFSLYKAGSYI